MKKRLILILTTLFIYQIYVSGQEIEIARITVEAGKYDRENSLVSANLDGLELDLANSNMLLYEIDDGYESIIKISNRYVWWPKIMVENQQ